MLKSTLTVIFSSFTLFCYGKLALKNLITYPKYSYTTFEPWNLHGEVSFVFRTNQSNGLLLYQDDGMHDFVELFLDNGNVRIKIGIDDCYIQEKLVQGSFNDFHWHRVRITREPRNVTFAVDRAWLKLPCSPSKGDKFARATGRFLYVASFPPTLGLNLNWLVFPGCLGDLWFTTSEQRLDQATLRDSSGTTSGCNSPCRTPQLNKCLHGGRCSAEIGRVECECQGTGYEGDDCGIESSSAWFNGSSYVLYDVGIHQPGRSTLTNTIAFRFATGNPDGVIVHSSMFDDHVVVELSKGFVRVSFDLGQGRLNITSREGCLHDGTWHSVTIHRKRRRVTLDLDKQERVTVVIPGQFSFLDFKGGQEKLYFCGGPDSDTLAYSYSRKNFTGIIQQLRFDEYQVIDEVFTDRVHKEFVAVGEVSNASAILSKISQNPLPLPNCSRLARVPPVDLCGTGSDDEDLCEIAASGLGPDDPACDSTDGKCGVEVEETEYSLVVKILPKHSRNSEASSRMRSTSQEEEVITVQAQQVPSQTPQITSSPINQETRMTVGPQWESSYYFTPVHEQEAGFLPTPALPASTELLMAYRAQSEDLEKSPYHRNTDKTVLQVKIVMVVPFP
ncbi:predicted protein [Nematostella vectensis]|uniref:Neurexin n=1 Tax=Nematostella vectensis TaxID=45351 RepID=A7RM09_NEMVE|nr:predicted protein [Nematostella vectensis]|eukprot:XP_001639485.1 predicted protein [Nematostella vectensis]